MEHGASLSQNQPPHPSLHHLNTPLPKGTFHGPREAHNTPSRPSHPPPPAARRFSQESTISPCFETWCSCGCLNESSAVTFRRELSRNHHDRPCETERKTLHPRVAHHRARRLGVPRRRHEFRPDYRGFSATDRKGHPCLLSLRSGSGTEDIRRRVNLLLDENLSKRITLEIADLYPVVRHVSELGLSQADDTLIWDRALEESFCIVSKDSDFLQRSVLFGAPPKVVFLRIGNSPTSQVVSLLRSNVGVIRAFCRDAGSSVLILG